MFTPENLKVLRAGDYTSVAMHSRWHHGQATESALVAYRGRDVDADERVVTVALPALVEYGNVHNADEHVRAWTLVHTPQRHELWVTFLHFVRPGEEVRLVWSANGERNLHLVRANLNIDTCQLEIRRGPRRRQLRFHIDTRVTPSDTARMFTGGDRGFTPIVDAAAEL